MRLIREIRVKDLFTYFVLPFLFIITIITAFIVSFKLLSPLFCAIACFVLTLISYFVLKRFVIGCVLMYKAFAPLSTRDRCRFEPTCSTYMVMAIKKYGLFRGVFKGIKRICRCKPPNGGIDYP